MKNKITRLDVILIFFLFVSLLYTINSIQVIDNEHQLEAENLAATLGVELQLSLNEQFLLMSAVESFTRQNHGNNNFGSQFDQFVKPLYENHIAIKNISVAPNGIQAYVYPLEGNEIVIGHDLINDDRENVRNDVKRTIETKIPAISGPYELRQGGIGLITRKSIYIDDAFWGIIAMVADFEKSIAITNIAEVQTEFSVQIADKSKKFVWGIESSVDQALAVHRIGLPEGQVYLVVSDTPASLRSKQFQQAQWAFVFVILGLLVGIIYYQNRKNLLNLERELSERTIEINILNNELEKSKMIAIGSLVKGLCHEVNTPLGSSLTLVTFLKNQIPSLMKSAMGKDYSEQDLESSQENVMESVEATIEGIKKSIGIINKLRDISEIQSTHKLIEFRIREYLEFASMNKQVISPGVKVDIVVICSDDLSVTSYPSAIYQMTTLLIENSMIHGFEDKKEGQIVIQVHDLNNRIMIEYSDNGVGISEEILPNIFEPFYTKDMSKYSGLGLYTVYNIVTQQLKGTVSSESFKGTGVTFKIELPKILNIEYNAN